jgi:hypothetical protein
MHHCASKKRNVKGQLIVAKHSVPALAFAGLVPLGHAMMAADDVTALDMLWRC